MSASATASTKAVRGSVGRQSPSLPQRLLRDSEDNVAPSRFFNFVENNRQTSVGTSHEALHRYFSSAGCPSMTPRHNSVEASAAAHKAQAQAAIDAVDAAMEEQRAEHNLTVT